MGTRESTREAPNLEVVAFWSRAVHLMGMHQQLSNLRETAATVRSGTGLTFATTPRYHFPAFSCLRFALLEGSLNCTRTRVPTPARATRLSSTQSTSPAMQQARIHEILAVSGRTDEAQSHPKQRVSRLCVLLCTAPTSVAVPTTGCGLSPRDTACARSSALGTRPTCSPNTLS